MLINRKLNKTGVSIFELRIGNLVTHYSSQYVVTGIEGNSCKVQIERFGTDFTFGYSKGLKAMPHDVYENKIVDCSSIEGVEMWDPFGSNYNTCDKILKDFSFYVLERHVYKLVVPPFEIVILDNFNIDDQGVIHITAEGKTFYIRKFWFAHEIQNFIYSAIGFEIRNELINKILSGGRPNTGNEGKLLQ